MAKTCMTEREIKRRDTVKKFAAKRDDLNEAGSFSGAWCHTEKPGEQVRMNRRSLKPIRI